VQTVVAAGLILDHPAAADGGRAHELVTAGMAKTGGGGRVAPESTNPRLQDGSTAGVGSADAALFGAGMQSGDSGAVSGGRLSIQHPSGVLPAFR
jgi:hypothetical protein